MNKALLYLIIIGVISLIGDGVWELYQSSSGNRSDIVTTVDEYSKSTLLNPKLNDLIKNDPDYLIYLQQSNSVTN